MFILALLGAFVFYVGLYLLYESTQMRLGSVDAVLRALNSMLWLPQTTVFVIFRGILIIATVYVIIDLLISTAKRATRKRRETEKNVLSWKKPPRA